MNMFTSSADLRQAVLVAFTLFTVIGGETYSTDANPPLPPFIRDHNWTDGFCNIDSVVPTNVISSFYEASTEFSYNLFKTAVTSKSDNDNIVYSPMSIWLALGMLMQGARGTTKRLLREKLAPLLNVPLAGYDEDDKDKWIRALYHNIMSDVNQKRINGRSSATSYQLSSANRLYLRQDVTVVSTFTEALTKCFLAEPQAMDFQSNDAVKTINDWVKKETNDKIKDIVNADMLKNPLLALILINAVYFKAEWAMPFTTENNALTEKLDFTQGSGVKKQVDFMTMTATFLYKEYDDAQMLGIPYKDNEVIIFIFLPSEGGNLDTYVMDIRRSQLIKQMSEGVKERLNVKIPKFTVETDFPLVGALKKAGLEELFTNDADLSGITGNSTLKVADAVHKAFIEVNEKGTEAAAATGVLSDFKMGRKEAPKSFRADRPFLFAIQHQANIEVFVPGVTSDTDAVKRLSKQILFFGRISNP